MPILRVTETAQITPRIPEAFRVRKGAPAGTSSRGNFQGGDDYGSPYLRMEPDDRFNTTPATDPEFSTMAEQMKARWEVLIAKGRIAIRFPYKTIEENFPWANTIHSSAPGAPKGSGKCVGVCDGITQTKWPEKRPHPTKPNAQITVAVDGSRPCQASDGGDCPLGCKLRATLKFFVPDLYPGGLGIFPIGSIIDVTTLLAQLEPYRDKDLRLLPFSLYRKKGTVNRPTRDGDLKPSDNWAINIELDPQISQALTTYRDRQFLSSLDADLDAEIIGEPEALRLAPVQPAPPPPTLLFKDDDAGMQFLKVVQLAIGAGDGEGVTKAVTIAEQQVLSGPWNRAEAMGYIQQQEQRARDALRDRFTPGEVAVAPPPPPPVVDELKNRLTGIRSFTEHGDEQIKTLAKQAGTTARKAATKVDDFWRMRRALITDWTMGKAPDLYATIEECQAAFDAWMDKIGEENGTQWDDMHETGAIADATLLNDWQDFIQDAISQQPIVYEYTEEEEKVEGEIASESASAEEF